MFSPCLATRFDLAFATPFATMSTTGSDAPDDILDNTQWYHLYEVAVLNNLLTGIVYGEG